MEIPHIYLTHSCGKSIILLYNRSPPKNFHSNIFWVLYGIPHFVLRTPSMEIPHICLAHSCGKFIILLYNRKTPYAYWKGLWKIRQNSLGLLENPTKFTSGAGKFSLFLTSPWKFRSKQLVLLGNSACPQ